MSTNTKVLLLEPDDDSPAVYADAVHGAGFDVTAVSDARIALEIVSRVRPRLIVASCDSLTRGERRHFCEQLKDDRRTSRVPVLLISTNVEEDDLRLAMTAGALVRNLSLRHADQRFECRHLGAISIVPAPRYNRPGAHPSRA